MKYRGALAWAAALALGAGGLAWWLTPPEGAVAAAGGSPASRASSGARWVDTVGHASQAAPAPRQGQITADDPFLTADLRYVLEEMLLEAGEVADPAALKQKLAAIAARRFGSAHLARAVALTGRYVDYRVALGQLKPPADPGDPRALRAALEARQRVRQQHFSPEEYDTLFAQEAELDRFTVARIEIERNPALTAAQKQMALRDAERELGQEQRALRTEAVAHMAVAAQTAALDARNASDQERYAERRAQYGDAAAQQLGQLDREERDWQGRLTEYATAQARQVSAAQLQQLRNQLFNPQEQLRIEAALAARQAASPAAKLP